MVVWDVTINGRVLVRMRDREAARRIAKELARPGALYEVPEDVGAAYRDSRAERKPAPEVSVNVREVAAAKPATRRRKGREDGKHPG